jgi:hypothetical protein
MILRNFICLAILLCHCFYSPGQQTEELFTDYKVGNIPGLHRFMQLTHYEARRDSIMDTSNARTLKSMLDGNGFIKGTPQGLIDSAIDEQRILIDIHYRDNRSREKIRSFKNGVMIAETENEITEDSPGSQCDCVLSGDTLHIDVGMLAFGGYIVPIKLVAKKFSSQYYSDDYHLRAFKLNKKDTLTDRILVSAIEQELILDRKPAYTLGQQLTGYLTFKTADYYRAADYESWAAKDEYDSKNMDTIYTTGIVHFTCKVMQETVSKKTFSKYLADLKKYLR